jgi:Na+/H+ antiporter NhaD/arsenite permease-like protein
MCGDPPNIIVGTSLGYSFGDFLTNTGFMAGISLIASVLYFYFIFRKELSETNDTADVSALANGSSVIKDKKKFACSCVIFLLAVVLLVSHAKTGLTVAFIGTFIAILTLVANLRDIKEILKKVDYKTLLFFIGLFVVVGGLEETGILEVIAGVISRISQGNAKLLTGIIVWVSAVASAFIDNIPFAATMIPVIRSISQTDGIALSVLAWALSMGTDIGGSATPIGASANVVGTSVAAKEGYPISWGKYCLALVPATIMVLIICTVCIWVRYL